MSICKIPTVRHSCENAIVSRRKLEGMSGCGNISKGTMNGEHSFIDLDLDAQWVEPKSSRRYQTRQLPRTSYPPPINVKTPPQAREPRYRTVVTLVDHQPLQEEARLEINERVSSSSRVPAQSRIDLAAVPNNHAGISTVDNSGRANNTLGNMVTDNQHHATNGVGRYYGVRNSSTGSISSSRSSTISSSSCSSVSDIVPPALPLHVNGLPSPSSSSTASAATSASSSPIPSYRFNHTFGGYTPVETFHVNEHASMMNGLTSGVDGDNSARGSTSGDLGLMDDTFEEDHPFDVRRRDIRDPITLKELKIISAKGTIRGIKNRVREGIQAFYDHQLDGLDGNKKVWYYSW